MTKRPFFLNLHVPKCGGTTFRTILGRNFRGRYEEVYNLIWEAPYTAAQIAFFVADSPGYDCLSSHRLSLDLPFDACERPLVALAFVRDPVDRFFSHYFYERRRAYRRERFAAIRDLTPAQYVDRVIAEPAEHYLFDYQFRNLTRNVAEPSLAGVLRLVEAGRLLLLPLERFDESLLVLRARFPEDFRDCRYVRQNVSAKDRDVEPAARQRVAERMATDARLHAAANAWLDAQLDGLYPDRARLDAELARLRRSCRRHELLAARPVAWAKAAFARVSRMLGV